MGARSRAGGRRSRGLGRRWQTCSAAALPHGLAERPPRPLRRRSGSACCARKGSGGAAAMAGPRGHLTGRGLQRYNTSVDRRRRPPASLDGRAHFVSGKRNLTKTLLAHMPEIYFRSKGRTAVLRLTAVGEEAWDERNPMGLPRQASWRRGDAYEDFAEKCNT